MFRIKRPGTAVYFYACVHISAIFYQLFFIIAFSTLTLNIWDIVSKTEESEVILNTAWLSI